MDNEEIKLVIEIRRCATCHCSEDLVNYTFGINGTTMRRYFICRSHNRARNTKYRYKRKMKELNGKNN